MYNDLVCYKVDNNYLIIAPEKIYETLALNAHQDIFNLHSGQNQTYKYLKQAYIFPKMEEIVNDVVNRCDLCSRNKARKSDYSKMF